MALGDAWLKEPNLEVSIYDFHQQILNRINSHIFIWLVFHKLVGFNLLPSDPEQEAARARGETFLSKLKLQFQRSATENTLITSQLNSPEHLKLTGLPARLIVALYEHSSVEQHYRDTGGQTYPGECALTQRSAVEAEIKQCFSVRPVLFS